MFDGLIDGRMDREPTPEEAKIILKNAAALVRRGHTQRRMAADRFGKTVSSFDAGAVKFCAAGAIRRAAYNNGFTTFQALRFADNYYTIVTTNDRMKGLFKGFRMASHIEKLPVPA